MNYITGMREALGDMLAEDPKAVVCGQLVRWGTAGLTAGLHDKYPNRVITFPVSEALMNAAAMGLALAGHRVVMIHERMDFVAVGMDALVNHIPIWRRKCGVALPLTIVGIVGKGHGQGPQHSKNFHNWFANMEGWRTINADCACDGYISMRDATSCEIPTFLTIYRELFSAPDDARTDPIDDIIRMCGAGERYERDFYRRGVGES